jgi:hypothetical protein
MVPVTPPALAPHTASAAANDIAKSEAPSLADVLQNLTMEDIALVENIATIVEGKIAGRQNKDSLLETVLACLKGDAEVRAAFRERKIQSQKAKLEKKEKEEAQRKKLTREEAVKKEAEKMKAEKMKAEKMKAEKMKAEKMKVEKKKVEKKKVEKKKAEKEAEAKPTAGKYFLPSFTDISNSLTKLKLLSLPSPHPVPPSPPSTRIRSADAFLPICIRAASAPKALVRSRPREPGKTRSFAHQP